MSQTLVIQANDIINDKVLHYSTSDITDTALELRLLSMLNNAGINFIQDLNKVEYVPQLTDVTGVSYNSIRKCAEYLSTTASESRQKVVKIMTTRSADGLNPFANLTDGGQLYDFVHYCGAGHHCKIIWDYLDDVDKTVRFSDMSIYFTNGLSFSGNQLGNILFDNCRLYFFRDIQFVNSHMRRCITLFNGTSTATFASSVVENLITNKNISTDIDTQQIGLTSSADEEIPNDPLVKVFDVSDINYYIKDSFDVKLSRKGANLTTQHYGSELLATCEILGIVKSAWWKITGIPDINGNVYNINVDNINTFVISNAKLTIVFTDLSTLEINCRTMQTAQDHFKQLEYLHHALTWIRRDLYENVLFVDNGDNINTAVQNAVSGTIVVVRSGTYTSNIVLKNGVDLFFEEGCVLTTNTVATITDSNGAVNCKIMGFGNFESTNAVIELHNNSTVYYQFYTVQNSSMMCYCTNGELNIKGFSVNCNRNYDSDTILVKLDVDVLFNTANDNNLFPSNNLETRFYLRNGYYFASFNNFQMDVSFVTVGYPQEFLNLLVKTTGQYGSLVYDNAVVHDINIWNVFIDANNSINSVISFDTQTINLYGDLLANKPLVNITTSGVGNLSVGSLNIDSNNITASLLSNRLGVVGCCLACIDGDDIVVVFDKVDNADSYRVYKDGQVVHQPTSAKGVRILGINGGEFRYRALQGQVMTSLSEGVEP